MAQYTFSANLKSSGFPLVSSLESRTVLLDPYTKNTAVASSAVDKEFGKPEAYYMQDVLPTLQGYKSIGYRRVIQPTSTPETFLRIIPVRDSNENRGYLGFTASGKTYLFSTITNIWTNVTPAGTTAVDITFAYVTGTTYICYSKYKIYSVNILTGTLVEATLAGITVANIVGISASNNYLLLHDGYTVYWSSSLNPLDFVPSLITGAGSGVPASLGGVIIAVYPLSTGYAIYTTANIVLATFSGNVRYPWQFKEANNSAGISSILAVSYSGDDGSNYAWTSSGLLKVSLVGCIAILPEVTDFLSGRVLETFDVTTGLLSVQYLVASLTVRLHYSSSRYLIISYGIANPDYALVYDFALKRLGKLKLAHVAAFELTLLSDGLGKTYTGMGTATYSSLAGFKYTELITLVNIAASPKRTMAFLQSDGSIQVALADFGDFSASAVLLLGKYQMSKGKIATIQGVEVENIDINNGNFSLSIVTSLDGKDPGVPVMTPTTVYTGNNVRKYGARVSGINHSILFEGAFNIVDVVLTVTNNGSR